MDEYNAVFRLEARNPGIPLEYDEVHIWKHTAPHNLHHCKVLLDEPRRRSSVAMCL